MPRRGSDLLFALLVLLALALTVVAGLVLSGRIVSDPASSGESAPPPPTSKPRSARTATQTAVTRRAKSAVLAESLRIAATRGDCWVVAHVGSAGGPVLIQRVLRSGEQVTLHARRVWLELGAAGNVDITLNGKPRQIPSGTTNLVFG
jgi:RodZ C-terminal domain